jgi:hypothetical protein
LGKRSGEGRGCTRHVDGVLVGKEVYRERGRVEVGGWQKRDGD